MFRFIIFLLQIVALEAILFISEENKSEHVEYANCALKIITGSCKYCHTILTVYSKNNIAVDTFLKYFTQARLTIPLFIINVKGLVHDEQIYGHQPDIILLYVDENNYKDMDDYLQEMGNYSYWNVRKRFLIFVTQDVFLDKSWIEETFQILWDRQILRVLICTWENSLQIYAYNPYTKNFGYKVLENDELLEIFEYKITDLNGCLLKTFNFDIVMRTKNQEIIKNNKSTWVGPDGMVMQTFADYLNATLEVHSISEDLDEDMMNNADATLPFSQFVNVFRNLYDFDFIFNAVRIYADNPLDHVFYYERNDLVIIVPRSKPVPLYLYILLIFSLNMLLATIASFFTISSTIILLRKYYSQNTHVAVVLLDNYRLLLSQSPPERARCNLERFLLVLWTLLGTIFATLFQSKFISALIVPKYYDNVDTLSDLYKTNIKVHIVELTHFHIEKTVSGEDEKLLDHLVLIPKNVTVFGEDTEWLLSYRDGNGLVLTIEQYKEFKKIDKNAAQGYYHLLKQSPLPSFQAYDIPKDKLYFNEFSKFLARIQQSGIKDYWRRYNYGKQTSYVKNDTLEKDVPVPQTLKLPHFHSGFIILTIGYILASALFLYEIFCKKRNKN